MDIDKLLSDLERLVDRKPSERRAPARPQPRPQPRRQEESRRPAPKPQAAPKKVLRKKRPIEEEDDNEVLRARDRRVREERRQSPSGPMSVEEMMGLYSVGDEAEERLTEEPEDREIEGDDDDWLTELKTNLNDAADKKRKIHEAQQQEARRALKGITKKKGKADLFGADAMDEWAQMVESDMPAAPVETRTRIPPPAADREEHEPSKPKIPPRGTRPMPTTFEDDEEDDSPGGDKPRVVHERAEDYDTSGEEYETGPLFSRRPPPVRGGPRPPEPPRPLPPPRPVAPPPPPPSAPRPVVHEVEEMDEPWLAPTPPVTVRAATPLPSLSLHERLAAEAKAATARASAPMVESLAEQFRQLDRASQKPPTALES